MVAHTALNDEETMALRKTGVPPAVFDRGNEYTHQRMGFRQYARLQIPYSLAMQREAIATLKELVNGMERVYDEKLESEWRYAARLYSLVNAANYRLRQRSK